MRYLKKENFDGTCRWCKTPNIPKPRRTFCSEECVHEYRIRTSGSYIREQVYKRDKGICSICKINTKTIQKKLLDTNCHCTKVKNKYMKKLSKNKPHNDECSKIRNEYSIGEKRKVWRRKYGGGLWDADHIVRVDQGGGCCGLDNLRTLCIPCHKNITYKQN